jgi:hypothetical protein
VPYGPPPGQNRKPIALIAGIIIGVLIIGGIIGVLVVTHKGGSTGNTTPTATPLPGPKDIAQTFYSDFQHQNYGDAYQYLASSFQQQINQQTFTTILACTDNQFGVVTSFTATLTSSGSTQAVVTVHVTRPQLTYNDPLPLVMEHGNWKITDFQASQACEQQA